MGIARGRSASTPFIDNLYMHSSYDALLFSLAHPRWEFVFQPKYAGYLNLIEPWWKTLRSLALKGRRFEVWDRDGRTYQKSHRLLERPQASLHLGQKEATPYAA